MVHRTVHQYQLGERIGVGGMGEIYKARDTRLNRFVAMKVLSAGMSADADRRRRFIQEAQAVSALNHPNIITIYDIVNDGETQYMVVEYVDGKTLTELIPNGGMPVAEVIRYATQMAEALCAAHAAGIIHRDLKPSNVMVTGSGLVKVLDFGLAKMIDWAPADPDSPTVTLIPTPMTIEGTLLGTVNYMSPEQAEGKKLDARTDIFSFGAVLYEMLTGQSAFRGNSTISTLTAVLRDDVRPIRELVPGVPFELERIVTECLKKDPAQRFQSMQEVQAALAAVRQRAESGVSAPLPSPVRRRGRRASTLVAVSVLVLAAAGAYWWTTGQRTAPPAVRVATPPPPLVASPSGILTNDDVLAMQEVQVAPSVMISQIRAADKTNFNLSAGEVIRLTKAGVPADVIEVMRDPKAAPVPQQSPVAVSAILSDGLLMHLILQDDIPNDAAEGALVRFKVADDVLVDDAIVIRKGASAVGVIVDAAKKKILPLGGKMTFRLDRVDAVDGQKVVIRATPAARSGSSKRPVDTGAKKPKDVAASAGTVYPAYVDGAKTLAVKKS